MDNTLGDTDMRKFTGDVILGFYLGGVLGVFVYSYPQWNLEREGLGLYSGQVSKKMNYFEINNNAEEFAVELSI